MRNRLDRLWAVAIDNEDAGTEPLSPEMVILVDRRRINAGPDWPEAQKRLEGAARLRNSGRAEDAVAEIAAAFAYTAPSANLLPNLVTALMATADLPTAEIWARRGLAHSGESPDMLSHLAVIVWGQGRHSEAMAECDALVEKYPHDAGAVATAATLYSANRLPNKALDACLSLLADDTPPDHFCLSIYENALRAAMGSARSIPEPLMTAIREWAARPDATELRCVLSCLDARVIIQAGWSGLFSSDGFNKKLDLQTANAIQAVAQNVIEGVLSYDVPPEIIGLDDLDGLLRAYGGAVTRPDCLRSEGFDDRAPHFEAKDAGMPERAGFPGGSIASLQLAMASAGQVTMISPFGGAVTSAGAFVVHYRPSNRLNGAVICYAFSHPRPLFVIFATETLWPVAWYDPVKNILLSHPDLVTPGFIAYNIENVRDLKLVILSQLADALAYLHRDEQRRGKPATLLFGTLDYLSTHILDLQGVQKLVDAKLLGSVGSILVTAPEPLGRLESYFLGTPTISRDHFKDIVALNHHLFRENAFSIRVTGGHVSTSLAHRIVARASARATQSWRAEIDELASLADPLIFVALRGQSRRWLASSEEIAAIFNTLQSEYPRLALVFDGYTRVDGGIPERLLATDLHLISPIQAALAPGLRTMLCAGRSIEDAIYAADRSHMHLSAQGTTSTKSVMIAGKPGVIVTSRQFQIDFEAFRNPRPFTINPREHAIDSQKNNSQCDYWLDQEIVLDGLRTVIQRLKTP